MTYVVSFLLALVIGWDLAKPLKNHPAVFYVLAAACAALCVAGTALRWQGAAWGFFTALVGEGQLAFFLFSVVMFCGCFKVASKPRIRLKQVRQPLALCAVILSVGHLLYAGMDHAAITGLGTAFGLTCGLLAVLLALLGITSVLRVQDRLNPLVFAALHKSAYPFYAALCVHSFIATAHWVYAAALVLYAISRTYRWKKDGQH